MNKISPEFTPTECTGANYRKLLPKAIPVTLRPSEDGDVKVACPFYRKVNLDEQQPEPRCIAQIAGDDDLQERMDENLKALYIGPKLDTKHFIWTNSRPCIMRELIIH